MGMFEKYITNFRKMQEICAHCKQDKEGEIKEKLKLVRNIKVRKVKENGKNDK